MYNGHTFVPEIPSIFVYVYMRVCGAHMRLYNIISESVCAGVHECTTVLNVHCKFLCHSQFA